MKNMIHAIDQQVARRENDEYHALLNSICRSFDEQVKYGKEPVFTTDVENLYDVFLNNLPFYARQTYDCRACRNFVNKYGSLVRINDEGYLEPVMWEGVNTVSFFADAVEAVYDAVTNARVTGVFITSEKTLGTPKTGIWEHMAVYVPKPMIYSSFVYTTNMVSAEKREDFKMLAKAASEYSIETVEAAVNLLRSDSMYRGNKILGNAEWFLDALKCVKDNRNRRNILWKKVATAPSGFCHISSSMIGTLLDDISEGMSIEAVQRRFNEKMDPLKYQRPQVAPSAGNVARAEKIVAELGLENSLKRRFARLDEIETIWKPVDKTNKPTSSTVSSGVFSDIKTKESTVNKPNIGYRSESKMTWVKFQRTVLPIATKIELDVHTRTNSYAAIVTAEDPNATPIICWDKEDHRNPFNWYLYSGGSLPGDWNMPRIGFVEVTGITLQPNLWQPEYEHHGEGVLFILKGCKDMNNKSSALFPEHMRSELREVRSTIEAYSKQHALSGYDEASACGLLLQSKNVSWYCKLRVTTDVGVSIYNLDRWD